MSPNSSDDRSVATNKINKPEATQKAKRKDSLQVIIVISILVLAAGFLSRDFWLAGATSLFGPEKENVKNSQQQSLRINDHYLVEDPTDPDTWYDHLETDGPSTKECDNDHSKAAESSIQLSEQAQKNIGLVTVAIEPRDFDRTISVPAMVAQRPGQTDIKVSAPMTGIVERIYPIRGAAVEPGQPLFDLRLTHKDLVETQIAFLQIIEQLDVTNREVARLDKVTSSGAIAGKRLLERQYEQQQIEARLRAQQQALILHGLSVEQVESIKKTRKLLKRLTVFSPQPLDVDENAKVGAEKVNKEDLLQVSTIEVGRGEHVNTGDLLCVLSDHKTLYIEGKAFEEDAGSLNEAANTTAPITALIETTGKKPRTVSDLKILYLENEVEQDSRALRFYISLPNELIRNEKTKEGHRFIGWQFKPGQRVRLLIPVERWKNRIVLPVDAVIDEGSECYIFQKNGDCFERKPAHVEYRDQRWAVIDNDGSLFPGDIVVTSGAYQIYLTMKNKSGGGIDPHAGCQH
jgi:multidrug efflux pump subunit AcrA (membrane-fusion protein)